MFDRFKKICAVVALTILIWAWAYQALEETTPATGTLNISPATQPDLFVSFDQQPVPVTLNLTLKGSPSHISELKKRLRADDTDPQKERLEFFYDAKLENHDVPGRYPLDLLAFLKESDKLKDLAVTVEQCEPSTINVDVRKLTQKWFTVQCLDENKVPLRHELIEPSTIQMYAFDDWAGDSLKATVILTAEMIERPAGADLRAAVHRAGAGTPALVCRAGEDQASLDRKPPEGPRHQPAAEAGRDLFEEPPGQSIRLNCLTKTSCEPCSTGPPTTPTAHEKMPYLIMIESADGTRTPKAFAAHYLQFPAESVRKGEIELTGAPREAVFKLVPVTEPPG